MSDEVIVPDLKFRHKLYNSPQERFAAIKKRRNEAGKCFCCRPLAVRDGRMLKTCEVCIDKAKERQDKRKSAIRSVQGVKKRGRPRKADAAKEQAPEAEA